MSAGTFIFRRELKGYFTSPVFYIFCMFFLILTGALVFGPMGRFYETRQADLMTLWRMLPILLLVMVPAIAMNLWAEERRSKTIELLFTLPITKTQAVLGKFFAGWVILTVVLAGTLVIPWTANYLGNPDNSVIMSGYLGTVLLAGAYLSIGMFASAMTKSPIIAFVIALVIGFFMVVIGLGDVRMMIGNMLPSSIADLINGFGFWSHHENFFKGKPRLSDFLYYFSIIGLMLYATNAVLRSKAAQ